ncbi:MAG TPA: GNAT family N-acetyltransferase [Tepidiformaceae bacterium]|nr:GNAT family N-acetyltransferase [Tepidiformaceae bacterium]
MDAAVPGEVQAQLRTGEPVRIRPILPTDVPNLLEFHSRLSVNTTRLRFFTPMRRLSPQFAEHLCTVDFVKRTAFVVSPAGADTIFGVGRYEAESETSAELAFVVEDAKQGTGVGSLLMNRLIDHARARGFERLTAVVLCENEHMLTLFRESPYLGEITMEHDCAFVKLNIGAAEGASTPAVRRRVPGLVAMPSRKA